MIKHSGPPEIYWCINIAIFSHLWIDMSIRCCSISFIIIYDAEKDKIMYVRVSVLSMCICFYAFMNAKALSLTHHCAEWLHLSYSVYQIILWFIKKIIYEAFHIC